jgi:hypothetical protein
LKKRCYKMIHSGVLQLFRFVSRSVRQIIHSIITAKGEHLLLGARES